MQWGECLDHLKNYYLVKTSLFRGFSGLVTD